MSRLTNHNQSDVGVLQKHTAHVTAGEFYTEMWRTMVDIHQNFVLKRPLWCNERWSKRAQVFPPLCICALLASGAFPEYLPPGLPWVFCSNLPRILYSCSTGNSERDRNTSHPMQHVSGILKGSKTSPTHIPSILSFQHVVVGESGRKGPIFTCLTLLLYTFQGSLYLIPARRAFLNASSGF